MRQWLFIYTNCFPTVPSNAEWHFEHICTCIRQMIFSSPSWEIGNILWHMWALAYTTARFPLSSLQIEKFRWESSSTFYCPQHLNNPAQTEACPIYAQLCTGMWPDTSENPTDVNILQKAESSLGYELQKCLSWARGEESRDNPLSSTPTQMHWRVGKQ